MQGIARQCHIVQWHGRAPRDQWAHDEGQVCGLKQDFVSATASVTVSLGAEPAQAGSVELYTDLTPLHSCIFASLFPALLYALDHPSNALALAQVVPQNRVALDSLSSPSHHPPPHPHHHPHHHHHFMFFLFRFFLTLWRFSTILSLSRPEFISFMQFVCQFGLQRTQKR